jgi:poly-gamma-glutamate synthesis protein (capsule biosynthesis protein)
MKKLIFIILLIIFSIILFYWTNTKYSNYNQELIKNNNNTLEEIVIYTQPVLKNDIQARLNVFASDKDILITVIDDIGKKPYDIAILTDKNEEINNTNIVYSQKTNLSPDLIEQYYQDKIPNLEIHLYIKNYSHIAQSIENYLKKSFIDYPPQKNKLIFIGCILLSRWVALKSQQNNDYTYPFQHTAHITKNSDLTIANLETPFAETGPYTELGMVFRGDPKLIEGLIFSKINVVNLANNHFGDAQRSAMHYTFELLKQNNISYFGAGIDNKHAREPLIIEINNIKYAFLGYADSAFTPLSYASTDNYAGLNIMDEKNLIEDLKNIKTKADFIIVSMHAGTEYTYHPNTKQTSFARTAIDHGANMVYGHHPHVVQAIEYYKNKPIFYSQGNFAMDQIERNTKQGYILEIETMFNTIININIIPYHIHNYSQPKPTENKESEEIIENIISATKKIYHERQ